MYTLVIYDITDNDVRMKIAQVCKEAGLVRIQKSAFLGVIDSQTRKGLEIKLRNILGSNKGNIQLFIICEADISYRKIIGQTLEYEEDENIVLL
ncbi:MAG: CRISPR-associated endonuclease Cas2 [Nitrososphaerota archaeon]|nr:CRISPR-associated endonuclease Cas2 [Candidatus Geocrenenecus dongiae]